MRDSCCWAARAWTGLATSGGTSSRRARSASSRPRRIGSSPASTPCRATTRSSSRCRSDGVDQQAPAIGKTPVPLIPSADLPISQRPQIRQLLLHASDLLPWVLLQATEALAQIEQRVLVAALGAGELLPRHRRRHRRALAGARGIRRDRGLFQGVAQIVDEDFSLA